MKKPLKCEHGSMDISGIIESPPLGPDSGHPSSVETWDSPNTCNCDGTSVFTSTIKPQSKPPCFHCMIPREIDAPRRQPSHRGSVNTGYPFKDLTQHIIESPCKVAQEKPLSPEEILFYKIFSDNTAELSLMGPHEAILLWCEPGYISKWGNDIFRNIKCARISKISEDYSGEMLFFDRDGKLDAVKLIPIIKVNGMGNSTSMRDASTEMFANFVIPRLINRGMRGSTTNFFMLDKVSLIRGKLVVKNQWSDVYVRECERFEEESRKNGFEVTMPHPNTYHHLQCYLLFWLGAPIPGLRQLSRVKSLKPKEALIIVFQLLLAMAVGEEEAELNHNDLNATSIHLSETDSSELTYRVKNKDYRLIINGLRVIIGNFSKSRFVYKSTTVRRLFYKNLENFPGLFTQDPDEAAHFKVYREIRKRNGGDWMKFSNSNLVWIRHLCEEMLNERMTLEQNNRDLSGPVLSHLYHEIVRHLGECTNCTGAQCFIQSAQFQELWDAYSVYASRRR